MEVPAHIFRMYDIRGIAEKEITEAFAAHLGKVFGTLIKSQGGRKVAVGHDARLTSPRYASALIGGFRSVGIDVFDLGMVPTPLYYWSLYHLPVDGGVQVTASHNPKEFNGFKLNLGKESFFGNQIQELRDMMAVDEYELAGTPGTHERVDVVEDYIRDLLERVKLKGSLRVALDTGNGTGGPVITRILERAGFAYEGLYLEPDGSFPHHLPDPTVVAYMQDLVDLVVKGRFPVGIGLDGDADRIGAVDEKGQLLFGDQLLAIFARKVLKEHPGAPIIFDVKCSQGLVEYIERLGGKPVMWKTGHALLKAKLREINAPLAGEMSGHMFFNDRYYGFDDAIYASLRLLEILEEEGRPLSELVAEIPYYHATPEIRVGCPDDRKFAIVAELVEHFKAQGFQVIDIDGARVQFGDGFGLVRASNTQPVLVLRFEAKTPERLKEIQELVLAKLREYPEIQFEEQGH